MSRLRSRLARVRQDGGFTLAETMVAMVVGTVVMGAAGMMFSASLATNQTSIARVDGVNTARTSAAAVTRTLRNAVRPSQLGDAASTDAAFLDAQAGSVRFYANIDNASGLVGPTRVTYTSTGGTLVQKLQTPTVTGGAFTWCDDTLAGCAVKTSTLASNVSTTAQLFTYYDKDGAVLPLVAGCDCLSATDLAVVNSVEVQVVVKPSSKYGASTYVTRVEVPNQDAFRLVTP